MENDENEQKLNATPEELKEILLFAQRKGFETSLEMTYHKSLAPKPGSKEQKLIITLIK